VPTLLDFWGVWSSYLSEQGNGARGGLSLTSGLIAVVAASITAAIWVQSSLYSTKVGIEQEIRQVVQENDAKVRGDVNEKLSHYLTVERFLLRVNQEKDDYNALLAAVDRIGARVARNR
jgi:hypothetical protein